MMSDILVQVKVTIREDINCYDPPIGIAEVTLKLPAELFDELKLGSVFESLLPLARDRFKEEMKKQESE